MASYVPTRFGNGTGTTTATATTTVTAGHRFILTGGAAVIKATAGDVTCVVTTGAAVQTFTWAATNGGKIAFIFGEGGGLAAAGTEADVVIPIGKHFVALSGETLSVVITGAGSSTGANVVMHGVDYTQ